VDPYRVLRAPRQEMLRVRGLDLRLRRWGPPPADGDPLVLLLHGWQDTGDTFQFLVDAFERDWPLAALDWRGFGHSGWSQDGYWFPDYLADLDALLDIVSPNQPARLVGHSMGANVACLYAGIRPARVRALVNLEGVGLPRTSPDQAPARYAKWLDQVRTVPPLKDYDSFAQLASIIRFRYPRFGETKSEFVARAWARVAEDGRVHLLGDSRHRWANPTLYKRDEAEACWRAIEAPMLLVVGEKSDFRTRLGRDGTDEALRALVRRIEIASIANAGHMMHIERPESLAPLIESFLRMHR
jgi:pimeloyl-ACP methyl ester carboxylesterase